jgi:general secretion pathway protein F
MPVYKYIAIDRKGKQTKGILDAPSATQARRILRQQNLYVKTLEEDIEKRERELFPILTKFLYRVPRKDVALFARELGTLLDAGLPLDKSLTNIIEQTENLYLKKALIEIKSDVLEGESLSKAISKHPAIFPDVYANLIQVGEQTGTYERALIRLADLEEANLRLRNKVITALFYPLIMLFFFGWNYDLSIISCYSSDSGNVCSVKRRASIDNANRDWYFGDFCFLENHPSYCYWNYIHIFFCKMV